jgi:hypothetical protein
MAEIVTNNITRGRGRGVAVRTGDASELGHIARETQEMLEVKTPIQEKMERLGKAIGLAVILLAMVADPGTVLVGMELGEIVRTAVALAVGAVPEALPIVLTVTLAIGVQRMAGRNAIIRRLPVKPKRPSRRSFRLKYEQRSGSMEGKPLKIPEIMVIAATRVALGVGLGLLLADKMDPDQRRRDPGRELVFGFHDPVVCLTDRLPSEIHRSRRIPRKSWTGSWYPVPDHKTWRWHFGLG